MTGPREMTAEECLGELFAYLDTMIRYWATTDPRAGERATMSHRERLEGLVFSILSGLDGRAGGMRAYRLVPAGDPADRDDARVEGEPWWPVNDDMGVRPGEVVDELLHDAWGRFRRGRD